MRTKLALALVVLAGLIVASLVFLRDETKAGASLEAEPDAPASTAEHPELNARSGSVKPNERPAGQPGGAREALDAKAPPADGADQKHKSERSSDKGNEVELAAPDDEGERNNPVSSGQDAAAGRLQWEEEAPPEEVCLLKVRVVGDKPDVEVQGVVVHVRRQERYDTVLTAYGRTDEAGRLEVSGLPIAWYRVSVEDDDAMPATRAYRCDGGETKELELVKRAGDARLFGRVLERGTDEPLAGAEVTIQEITRDKESKDFKVATQLTVDDEGAFDAVVRGDKSWDYRLYAQVPGYDFTKVDVRLKAGEHKRITFRLKPTGRVEGRVVTSSGNPAGGAHITQAGRGFMVGTDADAEGSFSMPMRPGNPMTVAAHKDGEVGLIDVPALAEGETRAGLVVQLRPGRTVQGRVFTPSGAPFPYAEVFVSGQGREGGGWLSVVQADGDGRFAAPGAPAAPLEAFATLPSVRAARSTRMPIDACPPDDGACAIEPVDVELAMPIEPSEIQSSQSP